MVTPCDPKITPPKKCGHYAKTATMTDKKTRHYNAAKAVPICMEMEGMAEEDINKFESGSTRRSWYTRP